MEVYSQSALQMLIAGVSLAFLVQRAFSLVTAYNSIRSSPRRGFLLLNPFSALANVVAPYFPFKGWLGDYYGGFQQYAESGSTCIGSVLVSDSTPIFWIADAAPFKEISAKMSMFEKDTAPYAIFESNGPNLVSSASGPWKHHRATANPAFNEANNALVWRESLKSLADWWTAISADQLGSQEIEVDLGSDFPQLSLSVLCTVAFEHSFSWKSNDQRERDLPTVLLGSMHYILSRGVVPQWLELLACQVYIPFLSSFIRDLKSSYNYVNKFILDSISSVRAELSAMDVSERAVSSSGSLLRNLVNANMYPKDGNRALSESELVSDLLMFFLAGQETTGHALCFVVLLLALHPEAQEKVFSEACNLWPDEATTSEDTDSYRSCFHRLTYTAAVIHEAQRLYPVVSRLSKVVREDTIVRARTFVRNPDGTGFDVQPVSVPVKRGSKTLLDISGLHKNPLEWGEDAEEFKPERFIDTDSYRWPRDAFQAFSSGPRACIGQRFAMVESVCVVAHLVRRYELQVPAHLRGKSVEEQRRALLGCKPFLTNTPTNARVVFRRRA